MFTTSPNLRPKGTVGVLALIRHERLLLEVGGRRKHGNVIRNGDIKVAFKKTVFITE